jgi:lantibiotic modifying enzyme
MTWRVLLVVLSVLAAARGQEANPVLPEAAQRLAGRETCVRLAAQVGDHLLLRARKTKAGITFDSGPAVYDGDAGVALLYAGLYRATRDKRWIEPTRALLDAAMVALPANGGLYTGRSGIGEACLEAYAATKDKRFLEHARVCAKGLGKYGVTDIISGAAGDGIFLLNLHKVTGDEAHLEAARDAGEYLRANASRKDGMASWGIAPGKNNAVYLGFSHGAAGTGYFLLHLSRRTKDARYKKLADEAARFVLKHEGASGYWGRTVPKSRKTQRLQWCHGAPGIGLFFLDLHRFAPHEDYKQALLRCVDVTRRHGRSARRSGCQCHGVAGNAELLIEARGVLKDQALLGVARDSGSALVELGDGALRVRMKGYSASYMTGLAGIGHYFLRLADPKEHRLPLMARN